MSMLSSAVQSMGLRTSLATPQSVFILPELEPARPCALTLLVLADGNRRSPSGGGYAGGARRVVSVAEHLARREDVDTLVACILSPDNIAKRGDGFFFELYKELIRLGVDIEERGALVDAGVRMEIWGDLESLRARGSSAVALADAAEAVAGLTEKVVEPRLRLLLGIGYGPDTARELDVDILLRTGMEEAGVLRLSGLQTSARIVACATATLWPDLEIDELDDLIARCKRRMPSRLVGGHSASAIINLLSALAKVDIGPPVGVTITTSGPPAAMTAALAELYAGPLRGCSTVAVEHLWREGVAPDHHGAAVAAPHVLRIVGDTSSAGLPGEDQLLSVLAPGQQPPLFTLPDWLTLGHANVHACESDTPALVEGIRAARRFSAAHPPLRGRERIILAGRAAALVAESAHERSSVSERDELGESFAARTLDWAASTGLLLPGAAWRRAARSYALTAFFIHYRIPTEWDERGVAWEERADLAAKYMILVAAGDEGIFDRVFDGETPEQRWARLEVSARFLGDALQEERTRGDLPGVAGAELIEAIARQWQELFDGYRGTCLPAAASSFRAGLRGLYAASLAEHRSWATIEGVAAAREAPATPPCVARRIRTLAEEASCARSSAAESELRALLYLSETSSAIGAGLLFKAAALAAPASRVTSESVARLDAAATLLDYHVRLANDMSGFLDSPRGDRDPKDNACTILVPRGATGAARAEAVVQALATSRRLAAWLSGEVSAHLGSVAAAWPSMGEILRRGVFVGRRVYEVGHYTSLSRAAMSAIFAEADAALH